MGSIVMSLLYGFGGQGGVQSQSQLAGKRTRGTGCQPCGKEGCFGRQEWVEAAR